MRQINWAQLVPGVLAVARQAGDAICAVDAQFAHDVTHPTGPLLGLKDDASPLTQADLAAHRVISAGLRQLTPDMPVVSEEDPESFSQRVSNGDFWLIDPLDGTKEFLARNGQFTVNIAWVRQGEPIWGVVYAPVLKQLYWGGLDLGAFSQTAGGEVVQIKVASPLGLGVRKRVVASKSHLNAETEAFIQSLGDVDLIQAGSSLKFCRVAEGMADVYPRLAPTCEWDTAAAQAVVEGAGGFVTDLHGVRLKYGKADVLNPWFVVAADIKFVAR